MLLFFAVNDNLSFAMLSILKKGIPDSVSTTYVWCVLLLLYNIRLLINTESGPEIVPNKTKPDLACDVDITLLLSSTFITT